MICLGLFIFNDPIDTLPIDGIAFSSPIGA